jgi:hypothetical protein
MPPKNKRQQQGDGEVEEPLQAVILTDSYDDRFLPISHEVPRVSQTNKPRTTMLWLYLVVFYFLVVSYAIM